jgi:hypothetical protein
MSYRRIYTKQGGIHMRRIAMGRLEYPIALVLLACTLQARADVPVQTLRVSNADDLVNVITYLSTTRQPAIIRLAAGHYAFTRTFDSSNGVSFLPKISTRIQIIGADASTTFFEPGAGDPAARFVTVLRGGNLLLRNITFQNGQAVCFGEDAQCVQQGGGVAENVGGELQFYDCVLRQNVAGQAQGSQTGGGGAILNLAGDVSLVGSTVTGNNAELHGGALSLIGGSASIWGSTISANSASSGAFRGGAVGGGIYAAAGTSLLITQSTISANSVQFARFEEFDFGGGIYNSGKATVSYSAVTENITSGAGDGKSHGPGAGGGLYNNGTLTVLNSTIGGNVTGTLGAGIYNSGHLQVQGATFDGNEVTGLVDSGPSEFPTGCDVDTPQNCVTGGGGIWNEPTGVVTIATTALDKSNDCHGTLTSNGHNFFGTTANCTIIPGAVLGGRPTFDLVNLASLLGELQDDGVAGNAHYPVLAGSPLIDTGGNVGPTCTALDQLGHARVQGSNQHLPPYICDIGAIEYLR